MVTARGQNENDLPGMGVHGILAPVVALDRWLRGVLVALILVCAIRYVLRHPFDSTAVFILSGAAALAVIYSGRGLVRGGLRGPTIWVAIVLILWTGLTLVAPSSPGLPCRWLSPPSRSCRSGTRRASSRR